VAVVASKTRGGRGMGRGLAPSPEKNIIIIITTYYF